MTWARQAHTSTASSAWSDAQAAYDVVRQNRDRQAARVVAGQATGAEDCSELLAMLGLDGRADRPA